MAKLSNDVQVKVDELVNTIENEIRDRLTQALGINVRSEPPARKTRATNGTTGRSRSRGRRSAEQTEALAKKVATYVSGQAKGVRVDAIGKQFGLTTAQLMLPIAKALRAKLIAKKGTRRATTYLPAKK